MSQENVSDNGMIKNKETEIAVANLRKMKAFMKELNEIISAFENEILFRN
jgi:hypothetical protein